MSSQPPAASAQGSLQAAPLGGNRPQTVDVQVPLIERLRGNPRIPLVLAAAAAIAALVVLFMWSRAPDYRVLFSNLSDRDGGSIITALQQMNVPYKFAEGGGAILVPADSVHEARLRLAQQGLPKGGSVGFELMDQEKFGISQFAEQVNYQRSLEGELERTIGAISAIQSARVHLAIPKASVFVRDQQKPSASVMVNLYPGRALSDAQVNAIVHLIATAVPNLPVNGITVVDQNGDLLTGQQASSGLDAGQLKYVQQIEQNARRRIEAILTPMYGAGNAHAQVSADIDFSLSEQTAESYQPNGTPSTAAIRSQQMSISNDSGAVAQAGGVPGALSNEPPANANAPVTNAGPNGKPNGTVASTAQTANSGPSSDRKDSTTNYELDKTIRHIEQPMGGIRRLSAAVVINYREQIDAKGHKTMVPLTADQIAQTQALVKDALGFDAKRGDTVNVVNSDFSSNDAPVQPEPPLWKQPRMIDLGLQIGKYALIGIAGLYLFFGVLRPSLRKLFKPEPPPPPALPAVVEPPPTLAKEKPVAAAIEQQSTQGSAFDRDLQFAREVAKKDPKVVATVVKSWISDER